MGAKPKRLSMSLPNSCLRFAFSMVMYVNRLTVQLLPPTQGSMGDGVQGLASVFHLQAHTDF